MITILHFKSYIFAYGIGSVPFLTSFFSTIQHHLDPKKERYSLVLNELFMGRLQWQKADAATEEVKEIREELKRFAANQAVSDIENPNKPLPKEVRTEAANLAEAFVNEDNENLFDNLLAALKDGMKYERDIEIVNL
ncbi:Imm70 family immunity protein [Desmospora profundinema]|uniref:DNA-binding protein YbaB n=1 Tax=Desmospora profundinema TaxID=1571184 RepID=A0ABU1IK41_9BACL|nr:Imm70 family immunity protein [Desmospora profundinema]MDR6224185.1 DNA-binding protein YbaB [Desmospora profundinema]